MMKAFPRILSGGMTAAMLTGLLTVASAASFQEVQTYAPGRFTDVKAGAWYESSVGSVYSLGLMNGNGAATFNPTGKFTLAEAATIAAKLHSTYHDAAFTPAATKPWYQGAVDYCVANGIFRAGQFDSYTRPATRGEMAGIIVSALPDSQWTAKNTVTELPDVNSLTAYQDSIFKMYNAGILSGSDQYGTFKPDANITRAEVAAIVSRCARPETRLTLHLKSVPKEALAKLPGEPVSYSEGLIVYETGGDRNRCGVADTKGNVLAESDLYLEIEPFRHGAAVIWRYDLREDREFCDLINARGELAGIKGDNFTHSGPSNVIFGEYDPEYGDQTNSLLYVVDTGRQVRYKRMRDSGLPEGLVFYQETERGGYGVLNAKGDVLIPAQDKYTMAKKGPDCLLLGSENSFDVYSTDGVYKFSSEEACSLRDVEVVDNNPMFAFHQNAKVGLATVDGPLTQPIYERYRLDKNSRWGQLVAGGQSVVVCANGYVSPLGVNRSREANGYLMTGDQVYGPAGPLYSYDRRSDDLDYMGPDRQVMEGGFMLNSAGLILEPHYVDPWSGCIVYETGTGYRRDENRYVLRTPEGEELRVNNYAFRDKLSYCAVYDETTETYTGMKIFDGKDWFPEASRFDSKDGVVVKLTDEDGQYDVGRNAYNMACVTDLLTGKPVIETTQDGKYYDKIKYLGDGLYACRNGATWYLETV